MARQIPSSAGGLLSYFTRHRTLANLLFVLLLVCGLAAIPNMRTQFFPDVVLEEVRVNINWDNASAEDMDRAILQLLEPAVLTLDGVEGTISFTGEGWASTRVTFAPDWDMIRALADVQNAVDGIDGFPSEMEEPNVFQRSWTDRVTDVVITGPVGPDQLANFADEMVVRLFAAGVTRTSLQGVAAPQTLVEVPSVELIANDITMADIAAAIRAEVDTDPAGDVSGANARVTTGSEKRDPEQIAAIVLRSNADGSKLTIGDVATISRQGSDRGQSYFVGDNPAVSLRVNRSAQGDAIEIQRTVERVAEELQSTLPEGVTVDLVRTRAEAISSRLSILVENGLTGLALVVCLLFLFLNARTAFWVAAGIPVAMMAAIAIMYAAGLTLNMISLFGLIITLGIVVDDAIVVGEHADHRARHLNEPPMQAAENAARRMAMPVLAATLTTVIAFFGLMAVGGRFGTLIQDIPLTVIAVLIASLIECFLILPNHMAHALAAKAKERWYDWPSRQVNKGFRHIRETLFRPFIAGVIAARYVVLAGVVAILASQVALFVRGDVQWRFFNAPERGSVSGNFAMVEGATREDSMEMMRMMQRATNELAAEYEERYGASPVAYVLSVVGGHTGRGLSGSGSKDKDLLGGIAIELIDAELRPYSSFAFVADLQERVENHPLVETVAFRGGRSGPGGDSLNVRLYGAETDQLKAAGLALQDALLRYPEVSALEDTLAYDKEELILDLTPQGQALGFKIDDLGRSLRNRLGGIEAATYPEGPRSAEIRVELPEGELTADFLERTQLRSPTGAYVLLADIVSVERRTAFNSVRRENGLRVISVTGDISEDDPVRATEIETALREEILPDIASTYQLDWQMAGLAEEENSFLSDAFTGLILCLTGIYLVLAWVFASWTRPIVVMAIIPFGLVGAIYGHWVWDVPLSMFTVVGLLGMTGIIINDSIVLVTTIDEYAQDRGLIPSIIDGAADRLRPVLLTTLTTVLGMMPLLYETSQQAQFLKPTVITLVYGLGFGMLLVLLVVPALIAVQHDFARQLTATRRAVSSPMRVGFYALWSGIALWLAVTLGWAWWQGEIYAPLREMFGFEAEGNAMLGALALFIAGAGLLALLGYVVLALRLRLKGPLDA
ncbi:AcrB/AcrD/AcrF family protein [Roseobacter denitrificans]|uniref:Putative acriflavine resistance protein n=1 Tax=Roseobacter denitrificans (strain ATCC 33942 / OCh 114) TaxID=375451 RepID=Q163D0_ROSDO|nr:efflux RND transporter permease subunit [Roseobacter denitrificans]ABG32913.1 putative acriflavine resistance protein [Roseobacter denitrificans OCh 114]AVL52304.1 AcrB/AcrD/AcrF family protein [Roseobacter denitrificans]SFG45780.1 Multidrug efflux pump subunit AcrB [Roseobacter denitrificans OCh 114]